MIAEWCRAGSAVLLLASAADVSDRVTEIETPGSGTLTMCRDWLLYDSCTTYAHVTLPKRLAIGDAVPLSFGSDNRQYSFPISRIIKNGIVCTVLSEAADDARVNKLKVPSCLDVSGSH